LLRSDDFAAFMADRQRQLLALIEKATGKAVYAGDMVDEGDDVEAREDGDEGQAFSNRVHM
jgi:hypothetical protein